MNQDLLTSIATLLNDGAVNYAVFLFTDTVPIGGKDNAQTLVQKVLGDHAQIGGIKPVSPEEVSSLVASSLSYHTDGHGGPVPQTLCSTAFSSLLDTLQASLQTRMDESRKLEQFWLSEGHPAFPVYWDFAFLFTGRGEATVLIGSSSD